MSRLLVDSHVHLHPDVPLEAALTAAAANFPAGDLRLLCLTDMQGVDSAERLRNHPPASWRVEETKGAFLARGPGSAEIRILPGRQILSAEGLELLALGLGSAIPDRAFSLDELIHHVQAAGALAVLPWGVGKWIGTRVRIVADILRSRPDIAVADNGNRLRGSAEPALLRLARERGLPVLLGSDPLSLKGAHRRIAACGNVVEGVTEAAPLQALREALARPEAWRPYGDLTPPMTFVLQQVRMQVRKRLKGRSK